MQAISCIRTQLGCLSDPSEATRNRKSIFLGSVALRKRSSFFLRSHENKNKVTLNSIFYKHWWVEPRKLQMPRRQSTTEEEILPVNCCHDDLKGLQMFWTAWSDFRSDTFYTRTRLRAGLLRPTNLWNKFTNLLVSLFTRRLEHLEGFCFKQMDVSVKRSKEICVKFTKISLFGTEWI